MPLKKTHRNPAELPVELCRRSYARHALLSLFLFAQLPYCSARPRVDPDTPASFRTLQWQGEEFELRFSDEFNENGRSFAPGEDEFWSAVDGYDQSTNGFQAYLPEAVRTSGGQLHVSVTNQIGVDPSGTPRAYTSGMLQSFNKLCFAGGLLEVSARLPGSRTHGGLWPAIWLSGNIGRVGFGDAKSKLGSNAGSWPWSYSTCDGAAEGQKFSACQDSRFCTSQGLTPAECDTLHAGKALLGSLGRGQIEIDLLEVGVWNSAVLSSSWQVAPSSAEWIRGSGQCYTAAKDNIKLGPRSHLNGWRGDQFRDAISAETSLDDTHFNTEYIYSLDWAPGEHLRWYIREAGAPRSENILILDVDQAAMEACGDLGARPIPQEPAYLIINLAMSNGFTSVRTHDSTWQQGFPYTLSVDHVRLYQRVSADPVSTLACDTPSHPSADYIAQNPANFFLPPAAELRVHCEDGCAQEGNAVSGEGYAFSDSRCPVHGSIATMGCQDASVCRFCYLRDAFERLAFTERGVYGNGNGQDTPGSVNFPICPPCVCDKWNLGAARCSKATVPESRGCSELTIADTPHSYCSTKSDRECVNNVPCASGPVAGGDGGGGGDEGDEGDGKDEKDGGTGKERGEGGVVYEEAMPPAGFVAMVIVGVLLPAGILIGLLVCRIQKMRSEDYSQMEGTPGTWTQNAIQAR